MEITTPSLDLDRAAACLEVLGSPHRLEIYRLLVQAGQSGLNVGTIRDRIDMPSSTLSHHIAKLVQSGLVNQERASRMLICCCDFEAMDQLLQFLTENCCQQDDCC